MFNNSVQRIIQIANSNKKDKYNILTFPTHERYETQLCKTGHNFFAFSHQNLKKWNEEQTELPYNYHILEENDLCDYLNYDFILAQSKFGQIQLATQINQVLQIPIISLEHTTPTFSTMSLEQVEQMRRMTGHFNIFISEYSKQQWGIAGDVIHHGIDTNKFSPNTDIVKENYILTVANDFVNRDYCLNYTGWKKITNGLKPRLVGDTKGLSLPASSIDNLVEEYNKCAVYFNSTTLSPIPMSLLEAMSCGCAIVSTATCMIPEIIKNGYNGYISNNEEELRRYLEIVLNDEGIRNELGYNARQTIIDMFSELKFINSWNTIFDKVYEVSSL